MILQRYIGWHLVKGWLLVLAILAAVFGLLTFIEDLDKTKRAYDSLAVARYTLSILPNQMVSLAPVIALLGSIVALANLDRSNELTVISAAGFPLRKLVNAILLPTIGLMVVLWVCMEYVTPAVQQSAENDRHRLRQGEGGWIPGGGVWSTDGRRYIHVGRMRNANEPRKITLFEFDETGELQRALSAAKAEVFADRRWLFQVVREKTLIDGELRTRHHDTLEVANLWSPDELPTLTLQGDAMNLSVLYEYSRYLEDTGQPADRYRNAFWQKLFMPFTAFAMVLLATPISAGVNAGRDRSFGVHLGIGALLGIGFYLGTQIIFALGHLLNLPSPLVAATPAVIILVCALVLIFRMRW